MKRIILLLVLLLLAMPTQVRAADRMPSRIETFGVEYPTYGNLTVGDCTLAAAADWVIVRYRQTPSHREVLSDFYTVGGTSTTGVMPEVLFSWWEQHPIAHHREKFKKISTNQTTIEQAIYHHRAAIAEVDVRSTSFPKANERHAAGYHMLVVSGYNAEGPELVSWGVPFDATWAEWNEVAMSAYIA